MSLASSVVGLVTGVAGTCVSAVVLLVLILARRHFGSHVNTLITNQSAMDLLACLFLAVSFAMSLPGAPGHYLRLGEVGNYVVCFLFRSRVPAYLCLNAEKIGLENDRRKTFCVRLPTVFFVRTPKHICIISVPAVLLCNIRDTSIGADWFEDGLANP